ncbi:MAG: hypothetical protein CM15mP95_2180 [Alphaproteobacteria bacterium]|nr:MAG: hypothetical protein CM15mP95_2180 [Alphaproteobacteria bacterium]
MSKVRRNEESDFLPQANTDENEGPSGFKFNFRNLSVILSYKDV